MPGLQANGVGQVTLASSRSFPTPQPLPGPANCVVKLFSNQLELNNVPVSQPSDSPSCRQPWQMLFQHKTENVKEFSTRKDLLFASVCLITACPHKLLEQIWESGQTRLLAVRNKLGIQTLNLSPWSFPSLGNLRSSRWPSHLIP